ncbi:unnamed protein product [Clonostachys rosea]|uniref:L-type lectin-like domain-containing protein n=1 Tax=Bionectria ochroleuca TaxID=29856 RepID=A0ABY6TP49_BIOOC|nr:unnamed protein product [Clonostachys rosea]
MHFTSSLLALLAASAVEAQQFLINELSFGHSGRLSPPDAKGQIPGFSLASSGRPLQILSNKVILTPISPGNQRGSIWSTGTLDHDQWVADVDFRANGPERGGGNLNIWLAKNGEAEIGSKSIYSVGKFEGLALVIDAHGGTGGMLRAFLSDGTVDYSAKSSIDGLAFGHCPYSYRNLGRPSQIKLRQTYETFKVEIDGRVCFETDKVALPAGYALGVTAATPDTPDSFEIFKVVVMSDKSKYEKFTQNAQEEAPYSRQRDPLGDNEVSDRFDEEIVRDIILEENNNAITEQLQTLQASLESTNHHVTSVYRSVSRLHQLDEQRHDEVIKLLNELKGEFKKLDQIGQIDQRVKDLEREVRGMRTDLTKKIQNNERTVKDYLTDHHASLSQAMLDRIPGHGKLIFIIIGTQVVLVVFYVFYKRRRANSPKKFL